MAVGKSERARFYVVRWHNQNPVAISGPWIGRHLTTSAAASQIRKTGFVPEKLGTGAGLGILEEPAGVYVSRYGGRDFDKEVKKHGLPLTRSLSLKVAGGKIWKPTERQLFEKAHEYAEQFLKEKYNIDRHGAHMLLTGRRRALIARKLDDEFRDWTQNVNTEVEWKLYFAKRLRQRGYTAVEWYDDVYGVHTTVVLDPSNITVLNPLSPRLFGL